MMLLKSGNDVAFDYFIYFILKSKNEAGYFDFFTHLKERYENGKFFFKYRTLEVKPPKYRVGVFIMEKLGMLKCVNKKTTHTWKISDIYKIEKAMKILERCKNDDNHRKKLLKVLESEYKLVSNNTILWDTARLIAKKEDTRPADALIGIAIAYYIENYGEDEEIREIVNTIKIIRTLGKIFRNGSGDYWKGVKI